MFVNDVHLLLSAETVAAQRGGSPCAARVEIATELDHALDEELHVEATNDLVFPRPGNPFIYEFQQQVRLVEAPGADLVRIALGERTGDLAREIPHLRLRNSVHLLSADDQRHSFSQPSDLPTRFAKSH